MFCVCVCTFVMTACQPAPQLPKPFLSQRSLLSSITFWMGALGDGGGCGVLSGRDKVRVSGPGWGGLSPVSALEPSAPLLEGRQVRTETHLQYIHNDRSTVTPLIISFWKSFNDLRINRSLTPPLLFSFHLFLCLPFVWLVSIPIIARFSDRWVTSEIESTWQPESARTASRAQISHLAEVLLSRDDDGSMKWTEEWCTRGVCLSQLGITHTPECVWPWLCECVCICVVFVSSSIKRHDSSAQSRNQRQSDFAVYFVCFLELVWQICNNWKQWGWSERVK